MSLPPACLGPGRRTPAIAANGIAAPSGGQAGGAIESEGENGGEGGRQKLEKSAEKRGFPN
jgi:hypothetical protein